MIIIKQFDENPIQIGESRKIILDGDGPFRISTRCFIDKPSPPGPGFLPCLECIDQEVNFNEAATIYCSPSSWSGKEGWIQIKVSNRFGERIEFKLQVLNDTDSAPNEMTAS